MGQSAAPLMRRTLSLADRERLHAVAKTKGETLSASVEWLKAESSKAGPRKFKMAAYTGATFARLWTGSLTIDLKGIEGPDRLPMLINHDTNRPCGVAEGGCKLSDRGLELEGYMLSGPHGEEIASLADQGFPLTASVGIRCLEELEIKEGSEREFNGRLIKGPAFVWTKTKLYETSFVTAGPADDATAAEVMTLMGEHAAPAMAASLASLSDADRTALKLQAIKEHETAKAEYVAAFPKSHAKMAREMFGQGKPLAEGLSEVTKILAKERDEMLNRNEIDAKKGRISKGEKVERDREVSAGFDPNAKGAKTETGKSDKAVESLCYSAQLRQALGFEVKPEEKKQLAELRESRLSRKDHLKIVEAMWAERDRDGALLQHVFPGGPELMATYAKGEWNAELHDAIVSKGLKASTPYLVRRDVVDVFAAKLIEASGGKAAVENLAGSWGRNAHSYGVMTVKGYLAYLFKPLEDDVGAGWAQRIGVTVPSSNQQTETHRWLGNPPQIREWLGNRQTKFMPNYGMTIENLVYEGSVDFSVQDWRFDKSGEIQLRLAELGMRMRQHWDVLGTTILVTNPVAYDNVALFGTTHTLGGGFTQSNDFSGDGSGGTTQLAALNVSSATNPTGAEMVNAIMAVIAQTFTYQDQTGSPINGSARRFVVVVPPNLWAPALTAMRAARLNFGQDNPLGLQDYNIDVIPNGWLVTSLVGSNTTATQSTFYVAREDSMFKPIIFQDVTGWESAVLGPGSDMTTMKDRILFGAKAVRGSGPGEWAHIARAKLTS